jgi:uncharacterized protein
MGFAMITAGQFVLVGLIIGGAFAIEAAIGFGSGLVAVPLLALVVGTKAGVPVQLVFQFLMGGLLFKEYRNVSLRHVLILAPSLVAGIVVGFLVNGYLSERWVTLSLALYLIVFLAMEFLAKRGLRMPKPNVVAAGIAGGLIQALFGTGGPPLVTYLQSQNLEKINFRATIIAVLFIAQVLRLAVSVPANLIQQSTILLVLAALPAFLLAVPLGRWLHHHIPTSSFRTMVNLLLAGAAIALLFRAAHAV